MAYNVQFTSQSASPHADSYIFVLSHMRSFSSLLCHILGSHSEISGYLETHLSYIGRSDLHRLEAKVRDATGASAVSRYVLDKILHNQVYIAPDVLGKPNVKTLFLLRNAEDTIRSILNMFHDAGRVIQPEEALGYYETRLQKIAEYSARLGRDALFLEAEKLLADTDAVLDGLSQWLQLDERLSANYQTFKFTGVSYYGDPSPNIKTGKVVANAEARHRTYLPRAISEQVLRRGKEVYAACCETLSRNQGGL